MSRTISVLSSTELDSYRKALHSRKSVKRVSSARLVCARKVARRAASILRKQFGIKEVVLFGSTAKPALFHSRSDVDVAVWGLAGSAYYRAVGILQSLDPEISVDLIAFETASPALQEVICRDGKPL
ncbi:MAG: nucleotidyltransferase domain-containing protein [Anaerolineales bacterium]|nr:nucleotidyltransferase domain-containing protein [Anaerolineales bacterium]